MPGNLVYNIEGTGVDSGKKAIKKDSFTEKTKIPCTFLDGGIH
jgi:hypothetical protein